MALYTECVFAFGVFPGEIETPLKQTNQVELWLVKRESPRGTPQKLKHTRYKSFQFKNIFFQCFGLFYFQVILFYMLTRVINLIGGA